MTVMAGCAAPATTPGSAAQAERVVSANMSAAPAPDKFRMKFPFV
jgi:hypothetical protein